MSVVLFDHGQGPTLARIMGKIVRRRKGASIAKEGAVVGLCHGNFRPVSTWSPAPVRGGNLSVSMGG